MLTSSIGIGESLRADECGECESVISSLASLPNPANLNPLLAATSVEKLAEQFRITLRTISSSFSRPNRVSGIVKSMNLSCVVISKCGMSSEDSSAVEDTVASSRR
jgi:hypothetical protein